MVSFGSNDVYIVSFGSNDVYMWSHWELMGCIYGLIGN
jgi:hypothetical protein